MTEARIAAIRARQELRVTAFKESRLPLAADPAEVMYDVGWLLAQLAALQARVGVLERELKNEQRTVVEITGAYERIEQEVDAAERDRDAAREWMRGLQAAVRWVLDEADVPLNQDGPSVAIPRFIIEQARARLAAFEEQT